ncbi:hypothetical protein [Nocardia anaemiae]|uniref:hypothetical protein n=1 Tax=Nocardia anaemiae TaxID=263910 RepID=UPI0007C7329F|nr:hypothetical protein [Nocardia anaemiae]
MTRAVVVQYRTRADCADHNQRLAEQMCHELNALDRGGVHFQVFRLEDGVGFVHVVVFDGTVDPFVHSPAFAAFHDGITDRLVGSTTAIRAVLIGSYHS